MNFKELKNRDIREVLDEQRTKYRQALHLPGTVPANSSSVEKLNISNYGHFIIEYITGTFTTLTTGPVDDGVCHLKGKLIDASVNRPLFDDFIPLELFLTPGRRRAGLLADASPYPNQLFVPFSFPYIMSINSDLLFEVQNDSPVENKYNLLLVGYRIDPKGIK